MRRSCRPLAFAALAACITASLPALLSGCNQRLEPPGQRGELLIAVRKTPAYYEDENGAARGFDHDLVQLFARDLGVSVRFVVARDQVDLLRLVKQGRVHFAAATALAVDADLRYSSVLRESGQLIVQHAEAPAATDLASLAGRRIEVLAGSPQISALQAMGNGNPPFVIVPRDDINEIGLLERVAKKKSEAAATDTTHFKIATNFYPQVEEAQELEGKVRYAWAFAANGDADLYDRVEAFIGRIRADGTLVRIHDRYFGHIHRITSESAADFIERVARVLPRYRAEFTAAQEVTGIDWRLLAALAYQESRWEPLATSPTGVRGMMMLTEDTADQLGVGNRLDVRQSIRAGARYLAELIELVPAMAKEPDRTWLALAAYNLGQGHMNGARAIAAGLKLNGGSWYDMKRVLPLLSRQKYYERLKSGPGRGGEAVIMVENVRTFYDILLRFEPAHLGRNYAPPMFSIPPMYERNDSGTVTLPLPF